MTALDGISWPVVENAKAPSGWGFLPELCCLLLVLLSALLYLADKHIAAVVMDVSVVAPPTKAAQRQSAAPPTAAEPEPSAAHFTAALFRQVTTPPLAPLHKPIEAEAVTPDGAIDIASAATGKPRARRYIGKGVDGYGLARLWRQRALRAADTGDYHGADRIYSQAMSLAVADLPLLQALAQERSLWLRHSGRHYAAKQVLWSVGLQP
ncbi:MAG: hypothetical protein ACNYPG_01005 [Candidatus Porifericomitaceae bacterium WSBS_2022_MAG_OTU9]